MSVLGTIGIKGRDGKYKNYTISISDFTNEYGQNISMYDEQTEEERNAKTPKKYIGNGKVFWTDGKVSVATKDSKETAKQVVSADSDDLPF
ncbi:MAG: hypothetical protein CBD98_002190 [Flavobacteriaceae bacterium TMED238]|jgi:hypothetical protein|nr:MAG: hypothetical protein CBD98_002190 [Flavobacteriaceae bacterium TMED238]BAR33815.1 hypothetical protein [uncultured Mediterranean phage uvMED]|tara:strand:- start:245 stop:517 length:273 start_codon:yes stop_codon:yes gene_type:complete